MGGDILGQLAVDAFARRANPERAVKSVSRSQWKGGFRAHSGPSRGDPRKRGFRPEQIYANYVDSDIASAISGISGVGEKPSSAGARTA